MMFALGQGPGRVGKQHLMATEFQLEKTKQFYRWSCWLCISVNVCMCVSICICRFAALSVHL